MADARTLQAQTKAPGGRTRGGMRQSQTLSVVEAMARLEAAGQPFLFFVNSETSRGYLTTTATTATTGLIVPAD